MVKKIKRERHQPIECKVGEIIFPKTSRKKTNEEWNMLFCGVLGAESEMHAFPL